MHSADIGLDPLIRAVLFEQNDQWQASSHHMIVAASTQLDKEKTYPILSITAKAA